MRWIHIEVTSDLVYNGGGDVRLLVARILLAKNVDGRASRVASSALDCAEKEARQVRPRQPSSHRVPYSK